MPEGLFFGPNGSKLTWWRRLTQTGMLALLGQWSFYGIFRCPFPVPYIACDVCPVITCWGRSLSLFWGFWLLLPVSALLFGRAFCGWACPGGLVNQMIGTFAISKVRVRNTFTKTMAWGPYVGLAIVLVLWIGIGNPRWAIPIRVGEFWQSASLTFEHANVYWLTRTIAVLVLASAGVAAANLWCRYACPTGGLLELVKRWSFFRVYKTGACNDCDACLKVCEMGTRPDEANCTNCGDCLTSCPVAAIQLGHRKEIPNVRK